MIFRIPALPSSLIPLPSVAQFFVLLLAVSESIQSLFINIFGPGYAIIACFLLIALEGLCGGLAYVNIYLRVGLIEEQQSVDGEDLDRKTVLVRREFRIACIGFADTLGILLAR